MKLLTLAVLAFSYPPRKLFLAAKGKLVQRVTGWSLRSGGTTVAERRGVGSLERHSKRPPQLRCQVI